ncbi:MAG: (deoxy)nucleoside triphosphate pyrophosphohydrolase [Acidobacteriota bacterium]
MPIDPVTAPPVHVVAAIIERDGKILIGQRKNKGRHALKWEFPGGKVEAGEERETALARELQEELAITAEIGEQIDRYEFRYGSNPVTALWFYRVTVFQGEPQNLDFQQILWIEPVRLPEFDFLEGDLDFIDRFLGNRKA